jgi:hypothetical protein
MNDRGFVFRVNPTLLGSLFHLVVVGGHLRGHDEKGGVATSIGECGGA